MLGYLIQESSRMIQYCQFLDDLDDYCTKYILSIVRCYLGNGGRMFLVQEKPYFGLHSGLTTKRARKMWLINLVYCNWSQAF